MAKAQAHVDGPPLWPQDLALHCYIRRSGRTDGRWLAHCIDFDLWVSAKSPEDVQLKLVEAIRGYVTVAMRAPSAEVSHELLTKRRGSLTYLFAWRFVRLLNRIRKGRWPLNARLFEPALPLQPAF